MVRNSEKHLRLAVLMTSSRPDVRPTKGGLERDKLRMSPPLNQPSFELQRPKGTQTLSFSKLNSFCVMHFFDWSKHIKVGVAGEGSRRCCLNRSLTVPNLGNRNFAIFWATEHPEYSKKPEFHALQYCIKGTF